MFRAVPIFLALLAAAQAQVRIQTFAGAGPVSGVPATQAGIGTIDTLAFDPAGNVVFTDIDNSVIWRLRPDGTAELVAGTGAYGFDQDGTPAAQARVGYPASVQFDAAGNLYFLDRSNLRIRRIDTRGILSTVVGNGVAWVTGMAVEGNSAEVSLGSTTRFIVDAAGNVYFGSYAYDAVNGIVQRAGLDGQTKIIVGKLDPNCQYCSDGDGGPATQAHLQHTDALALDDLGNLYIAENSSGPGDHVRRVDRSGIITKFAGYGIPSGVFYPPAHNGQPALDEYFGIVFGLAADAAGNIFVSQGGTFLITRIQKIGTDGIIQTTVEGTPQSGRPTPLYRDNTGHVVYRDGSVIRSALDQRQVQPFVTGPTMPSPDGTAARDTRLAGATTIAISHAGEVYFGEPATCRIRKFDSAGKLRTVAGTDCSGVFQGAGWMTFDLPDHLYVRSAGYTYIVDANGVLLQQPLRRDLGVEPAIAVDAKGRLYVSGADYLNRLELDGTVKPILSHPPIAGIPPPEISATFPTGLGSDQVGNVYFSTYNGVFRMNDDGSYAQILFTNVFTGIYAHLSVDAQGRAWQGGRVADASGTATLPVGALSLLAPNGDLYALDGRTIQLATGLGSTPQPVIAPNGIVNAASYTGGAIAPGELISIFGNNFGVVGLQYGPIVNNQYQLGLGGTNVLVNGSPVRFTAITANQINVFVPHNLSYDSVAIIVQVGDKVSAPMTVPVTKTAFNLFAANASGKGQGAILNQNNTVNSSANPAARNSIVSLFGTGEGVKTPDLNDGSLVLAKPYPASALVPRISIGGQPAEVTYSGAAPTLAAGVYQINVRIPAAVASGDAAIEVSFGDQPPSNLTTVAVQ